MIETSGTLVNNSKKYSLPEARTTL